MQFLISGTRCAIVNAWLCLLAALAFGRFGFKAPFLSESMPSIRMRNGGSISLGRLRARVGLRLFADGGQIRIGSGVFFNNGCSINCRLQIIVGEGTLFGENVCIYDHNHLFDDQNGVNPDRFSEAPIIIGRRCWLGANVVVLKGVEICDNVAIAAGVVVRKSIMVSGVYAPDGSGRLALIKKTVT